jgi:uncharacterized NAD(P)/FAD-binding protein YdhS
MEKTLARPDELLLGLDVSSDGALLNASGVPSDFLFAVGPLRKGQLWESVAVPELRVQAAELAKLFLSAYEAENTAAPARSVEAETSTTPYR